MLSITNAHCRDKDITFDEPSHVYTVKGKSGYKSVTTWIHEFFPSFNADNVIAKMHSAKSWGPSNKYYGKTNKEIKDDWSKNGKKAAEMGTLMHLNIEHYYNQQPFMAGFTETSEYKLFQEFLHDHKNYKAYRTEWYIYSRKYLLAGSIDMVYVDPDDNKKIIIADWKRAKEIKYTNHWEKGFGPLSNMDNCNYWHYTLQLNIYRMIVEKYYNLMVSQMFLVILHPDQDTFIKIIVPRLVDPIIKMLVIRSDEIKQN
jgi:ATP-dependent exoDNAse (exonuclease V) beta subunit